VGSKGHLREGYLLTKRVKKKRREKRVEKGRRILYILPKEGAVKNEKEKKLPD